VSKALTRALEKVIYDCGGGEAIPGWCVATGKCTCDKAVKLIAALEKLPEAERTADAAFKLGRTLGPEPS
jgi:hypothetical protein